MHETHMIEPIIKGIEEHAKREGGKKISKVHLKIGIYTGIKEESFKETFNVLAKGTLLEGAVLKLNSFPAFRIEVVSFDME